jgi:hypothetical protein
LLLLLYLALLLFLTSSSFISPAARAAALRDASVRYGVFHTAKHLL